MIQEVVNIWVFHVNKSLSSSCLRMLLLLLLVSVVKSHWRHRWSRSFSRHIHLVVMITASHSWNCRRSLLNGWRWALFCHCLAKLNRSRLLLSRGYVVQVQSPCHLMIFILMNLHSIGGALEHFLWYHLLCIRRGVLFLLLIEFVLILLMRTLLLSRLLMRLLLLLLLISLLLQTLTLNETAKLRWRHRVATLRGKSCFVRVLLLLEIVFLILLARDYLLSGCHLVKQLIQWRFNRIRHSHI